MSIALDSPAYIRTSGLEMLRGGSNLDVALTCIESFVGRSIVLTQEQMTAVQHKIHELAERHKRQHLPPERALELLAQYIDRL